MWTYQWKIEIGKFKTSILISVFWLIQSTQSVKEWPSTSDLIKGNPSGVHDISRSVRTLIIDVQIASTVSYQIQTEKSISAVMYKAIGYKQFAV